MAPVYSHTGAVGVFIARGHLLLISRPTDGCFLRIGGIGQVGSQWLVHFLNWENLVYKCVHSFTPSGRGGAKDLPHSLFAIYDVILETLKHF